MATINISSSNPTDSATDVFVNKIIVVTFDTAILESSLNINTMSLTDLSTNETLDISVSRVSSTVINISPIGVLAEDTLYRVLFPGTDTALSSSYVIKTTASVALDESLEFSFRTGSRIDIDDSSVDKDATDLGMEGDLNLPSNVKALGEFAVKKVVPKNHSADITTNIGGDNTINFTFDNNIDTVIFTGTFVDVQIFSILDDNSWLGNSGGGSFSGSIPGYSVEVTGSSLNILFDSDLPRNACVQIEFDEELTDTDGSELGPNEFTYSVTTDRWPKFAGVHSMKREIKAAASELNDDYIAGVLFAKTIDLYHKFGLEATPAISLLKWVVNSAIVDILDDKELEKALAAGTRRQLGDMNVSVDPVIGKLSLKHARAQKKIEEAEKSLIGASLIAKIYNSFGSAEITRPDRLWHGVSHKLVANRFITYQSDQPGANTSLNRTAKIAPSRPWW